MPPPPTLIYATPEKKRHWREQLPFTKRQVGAATMVLTACIGWYIIKSPWIWYGSEEAWRSHECLTYTRPANTVAFAMERTTESFSKDFPDGSRVTQWRPLQLLHEYEIYHSDVVSGMLGPYAHSLLFLHERTGPGGNIREICVQYRKLQDPNNVWAGDVGVKLRWFSSPVGIGSSNAVSSFSPANTELNILLPGKKSRLFFGQPDPSDASHFTIKYEMDDKPGMIDGWLQSDDTVKLQIRDGPAAEKR
jgi:hypothetical protein